MGSEAEGPLFQAMELPTPRPPRYNSEIFIVSCVLYFFFLLVCGLFVLALFVSKTSTSEARTVTFDLPLIAVPGARPVAVFGVAFFPELVEDTASSLRTLVQQLATQRLSARRSTRLSPQAQIR